MVVRTMSKFVRLSRLIFGRSLAAVGGQRIQGVLDGLTLAECHYKVNQALTGPDGVRKLLHISEGNMPRPISAIWLRTKASNHQNAAAMKP